MEQKDWFETWFGSPYYKILYKHRDEPEAQAFIEKLLGYLQPPTGCKMLDIACGDGRYARQLAGHGYDVTGIDLSLHHIEIAKEYEADNLHFYVHDMRMPAYINYFNYAFNFFTSFGYFAHDRDHLLAAKSFARSLQKGGTLVIDYLNAVNVMQHLVPQDTLVRGSYTFHINRRVERRHFIKDIRFTDADNKPRHYTESVAAFELADFIKMFGTAGLSLVHTFGDYKLQAFDAATSPRLIMVFKKQ
jgi:SAM-dependent methyltransferase